MNINELIKNNFLFNYLSKTENLNENMLIVSTAAAAISLIPSLRNTGSFAIRSIALLSSLSSCHNLMNKPDVTKALLSCVSVASAVLGLAGTLYNKPYFILAALSTDIAIHTIEMLSSTITIEGYVTTDVGILPHITPSENLLKHLSVITIDSFMLAAIVYGSWPMMVTAATISALSIGVFAISTLTDESKKYTRKQIFCYCALAIISGITAINTSEWFSRKAINAHFKIYNRNDQNMTLYGKGLKVVGSLNPGETKEVVLPIDECGKSKIFGGPSKWLGDSHIGYGLGDARPGNRGIEADFYDYEKTVFKDALPSNEFSSLPIGSPLLVEALHLK